LKQFLGRTRIDSNEEVRTVKDWWQDFYDAGKQKLITRYDKYLNIHGDYKEKMI
jgi:hypothetical protein